PAALLVPYTPSLSPPLLSDHLPTLHPFPTRRSSDLGPHLLQAHPQNRRPRGNPVRRGAGVCEAGPGLHHPLRRRGWWRPGPASRSEEHTSELQSRFDLVCRLLLEKNNRCSICVSVQD